MIDPVSTEKVIAETIQPSIDAAESLEQVMTQKVLPAMNKSVEIIQEAVAAAKELLERIRYEARQQP